MRLLWLKRKMRNVRADQVMKHQEAVILKLVDSGFHMQLEENMFIPIPDLLIKSSFPLKLHQHSSDVTLCFKNWAKLKCFSQLLKETKL